MQKAQLEEGVSQAWRKESVRLPSTAVPCWCSAGPLALLVCRGRARQCHVFGISLMEEGRRERSKPGAARCSHKHTLFTTLTHYSACLGHVSSPFIAAARLARFVYFTPELHAHHLSVTQLGTNSSTPTFAISSR